MDVGRQGGGSLVLKCCAAPHPGVTQRTGGNTNTQEVTQRTSPNIRSTNSGHTSAPPTTWANFQVPVFVQSWRTLLGGFFPRLLLSWEANWVPSTFPRKHPPLGQYSHNCYLFPKWGHAFCLYYLTESS